MSNSIPRFSSDQEVTPHPVYACDNRTGGCINGKTPLEMSTLQMRTRPFSGKTSDRPSQKQSWAH